MKVSQYKSVLSITAEVGPIALFYPKIGHKYYKM
jgi:hypothetical protein